MLTLVAQVLVTSFLGQVGVTLAPDQPIPHVYTDEPLIVEFLSPAPATFTATATFSDGGMDTAVDLGKISLRAGSPHWHAIEGQATRRGVYTLRISFDGVADHDPVDMSFCRIDRPFGDRAFPVTVSAEDSDDEFLNAVRAMPARALRYDAASPDLETHIGRTKAVGLDVILRLEQARRPIAEVDVEATATSASEVVAVWEIAAGDNSDLFARTAQAIRRGSPGAAIAAVVSSEGELKALLRGASAPFVSTVVLDSGAEDRISVAHLRATAHAAGVEGIAFRRIHASTKADHPATFLRDIAAGCTSAELGASSVYADAAFSANYCRVSAMVHQVGDLKYVGELANVKGVDAKVFHNIRKDSGGRSWVIAVWSQDEAVPLEIVIGNARNLKLTNALNNPLPVPAAADGAITLSATTNPQYLSGSGGPILGDAACAMIRAEVKAILRNEDYMKVLAQDQVDVLTSLTECTPESSTRFEFFSLLRMFPELEGQWHADNVSASVAVSLMTRANAIAERLCLLQEETGEPFLEPIQDTLAKCGEYQSLYLAGTGGADATRDRGNWLLAEVDRLVAEAKTLIGEGRTIQADAVAAVGEWRARSLQSMNKTGYRNSRRHAGED